MFFDDLIEEFAMLDYQNDTTLPEWLHRFLQRAEELEVAELPSRETVADTICDARGIAYDVNPAFPSPYAKAGDPTYAIGLLKEVVFTLRQNPGGSSPLYKHYGTVRIFIELYLGIKPE